MSGKKLSKQRIILIVAVLIVVYLLSTMTAYVLGNKSIYRGVTCCGVKIGRMSEMQAVQALGNALGEQPLAGRITLVLDGNERYVATDDFETVYSYQKTVEEAFAYGRNKNFFARCGDALKALFTGYEIPLSFTYNKTMLTRTVDKALEGIGTPVTEYTYEIKDNKFFVTNGMPGDMPDREEIITKLLSSVGKRDFDTKLVFNKSRRLPEEIDAQKLYDRVHIQATDAKYEKNGDDVVVVPHIFGVDFDVKNAKSIINDNKEYGKTYEIPAQITAPAFTAEQAQERLFTKTLGSYKSNYNSGDVSRSSNIHLAAQLVNNTVLLPGEEFSYNNTVGERTAAAGFKVAHVYMNNEVADGIGGGICQVSSTLYCAALYANVEIVTRTNHQLPVSYVPLGQDATVDYGNIDFKFRNNTPYPMKIVTSAGAGTMYASISGYKDVDEKVEIIPVRTSTVPPTEVEENDDTLLLGERKIDKQGADGSVVETYKIVTVNGVKGAKTLVSKSNYAAGKTIIKVGTKQPAPIASPVPAPSAPAETPVPSSSVVPSTAPHVKPHTGVIR